MSTTAPPRRRTTTSPRPAPRQRQSSAPLRLGNPRRRAGVLLVGALAILTIFGVRLLDIQAFRGDALAAAAVDQRTTTVKILADRGDIVDRYGVPLATTVEARNITVDQTLVEDPRATALAIAGIVGGSVDEITARLTGDRRFAYVVKDVTPEDWRAIDDLGLQGIYSERTSKRVYPAGSVGANVIGFVGSDGVGLGGIEYAHDEVLSGIDGWSTYERASGGAAIPTAEMSHQEPVPGTGS